MRLRITDQKTIRHLVDKGHLPPDINVKEKPRGTTEVCCPLPPREPSLLLYRALVTEFGRFYSGGEMVYELELPFGRNWRVDMALPRYRVAVEMDGYAYHGKYLSGFKRDREKSLALERNGWRCIRFSNEQVRSALPEVVSAMRDILRFCSRHDLTDSIEQIAFNRSRLLVPS